MIAKAIAEYMKENGIKQTFICEKTGMTKHSVSCALNGKRKLSVEEYELICKALNMTYDFFFGKSLKSA
ncbi:MAG: helix-turn-helix domain-containing protein [Streptococcaceae bacterium]|jgi:transcriptional regulator with XRE-family HTH domain|nr:helix-turn-helix domain-containing protein [Streptococcaceae bacterium]